MPTDSLTDSLRARWEAMCARAGVTDAGAFARLCARYREPQRHYHTLQHLHECFAALDLVGIDVPLAVVWAMWFHDAVYNPKARVNEAHSAELAVAEGRALGLDADVLNRAAAMIRATQHHKAADPETALLLDADLAILGAPRERFQEYEKQIRAEYAWVPSLLYRRSRQKVLDGFLLRVPLFHTPALRDRFEAQARRNLRGL